MPSSTPSREPTRAHPTEACGPLACSSPSRGFDTRFSTISATHRSLPTGSPARTGAELLSAGSAGPRGSSVVDSTARINGVTAEDRLAAFESAVQVGRELGDWTPGRPSLRRPARRARIRWKPRRLAGAPTCPAKGSPGWIPEAWGRLIPWSFCQDWKPRRAVSHREVSAGMASLLPD